jgi:hypothetical protein
MNEPDERTIILLSLFSGADVLPTTQIEGILPTINPLTYTDLVRGFVELNRLELVDIIYAPNSKTTTTGYKITEKGQFHLAKLKQAKFDEEVSKIRDEDEKRLIRLVNESNLETNLSTKSLNEKTASIYTFQKWITWITIAITAFGSWVLYKQYLNDVAKETREAKEDLRILEMNTRLDSLQSKLHSLENPYPKDTSHKNASYSSPNR